jgi:hypothetical protein
MSSFTLQQNGIINNPITSETNATPWNEQYPQQVTVDESGNLTRRKQPRSTSFSTAINISAVKQMDSELQELKKTVATLKYLVECQKVQIELLQNQVHTLLINE